jgi:predicted MPP superfamily phosphohydrolase
LFAAARGLARRRRRRAAGFISVGPRRPIRKRSRTAVSRITVEIEGLPSRLSGLKIAFAADFHLSYIHPTRKVRRAVRTLASLGADLILLGGDYLTNSRRSFDAVLSELFHLDAPGGVYAVPGNHDYASGIEDLGAAMAHTHITDLTNRGVAIPAGARRSGESHRPGADESEECLWLGGLDDLWHGSPDIDAALEGAPEGAPRIILCHNPCTVDVLPDDCADLILAGHTHGWQIYIPGLSHVFVPEDTLRYRHGFYHTRAGRMFVTRGVGHSHVPLRVRCKPEVVLIELRRAPLAARRRFVA